MYVFVITPGHTGSKWLTISLRRVFPEFYVHHECVVSGPSAPGKDKYRSLGTYWMDQSGSILEVGNVPSIISEADTENDKAHVYIGWDSALLLPYYYGKYGPEKVKVVYLSRDISTYIQSGISDINFYGILNDIQSMRPLPYASNSLTGKYFTPVIWQELSRSGKIAWWYMEVASFMNFFVSNFKQEIFCLYQEDILKRDKEKFQKFFDFLSLPSSKLDDFINETESKVQFVDHHIDEKSLILRNEEL